MSFLISLMAFKEYFYSHLIYPISSELNVISLKFLPTPLPSPSSNYDFSSTSSTTSFPVLFLVASTSIQMMYYFSPGFFLAHLSKIFISHIPNLIWSYHFGISPALIFCLLNFHSSNFTSQLSRLNSLECLSAFNSAVFIIHCP